MNPEKFGRVDNSIEDMSIFSDFLIKTNHRWVVRIVYLRHDIRGGVEKFYFTAL